MGSSKQTKETQQTSQGTTAPWEPSQGILKGILGNVQNQVGNVGPNSIEQGALSAIQGNAASTPGYGGQATSLANDLMSGGPNRGGILSDAYAGLQGNLAKYTSPDYLDPTKSPGMAPVLDTIRNDVGNSINGMFAGAGRDLSGSHVQSLARGLSQGMAVPLLNQYNQNVAAQQGAAGQLFGAGGATASGLSALDQTAFGNRAQGLDIGINRVPQAQNAPANNILNAEQMQRQFPLQNLGMLEGLTLPIAGLGSQSNGAMTGTTTGTVQANPWQVGIGGAIGGAGLLGNLFGANGMFGANGFFGRR